jgi:hypothetical protein
MSGSAEETSGWVDVEYEHEAGANDALTGRVAAVPTAPVWARWDPECTSVFTCVCLAAIAGTVLALLFVAIDHGLHPTK